MSRTQNILLWLPSPMGDAIMSTPALRAIRTHNPNATITAYANTVVRDILTPCRDIDHWLIQKKQNLWQQASILRKQRFTQVYLFKNSFGSAFTSFLAQIPQRIGYNREGRRLLLTHGLKPPKNQDGTYQARPMIDYYLSLAEQQGVKVENRQMTLGIEPNLIETVISKHPRLKETQQPLVILVPGGAFGPSKCWPAKRYAQIATWLIDTYQAQVAISVAPSDAERAVAENIAQHSPYKLTNLGVPPLSLGELKALYSKATLVIANDTGPRHIAIALKRNIITLFGPNNPAWTQTGWPNETQLIGPAPCAPCHQATCTADTHICMNAITVEQVQEAVRQFDCMTA